MNIKGNIKKVINKLPYIRWLVSELKKYKKNVWIEPGHYYSPIVSVEDIKRNGNFIFKKSINKIEGIDLNESNQFKLLNDLLNFYEEIPFEQEKNEKLRYYYNNDFYHYFDAISLYLLMRFFNPQKIIEIGSGFSSALMLDVNKIFFNNKIGLTFIEPFPDRLRHLTRPTDNFTLIEKFFREEDLDLFNSLNRNDFLFIDSSHVVKTGSELNTLLFEVLPTLKAGVKIHFHDIFFPFEYPKKWVLKENRSWNEAYFLRTFLMYNNQFEITLFNSFIETFYKDWLLNNMPLCSKSNGSSLWLSKL